MTDDLQGTRHVYGAALYVVQSLLEEENWRITMGSEDKVAVPWYRHQYCSKYMVKAQGLCTA